MKLTTKKPKVSVCVVTYNQEKYIRHCLQSILTQEVDFDFELIVGDDCSTDSTANTLLEFLQKYPDIVSLILHKKNIGATANYLSVHKAAKGDFVAHIDGDDFFLPNKLALQANFLTEEPDCIAVAHKLAMTKSNGESALTTWPSSFTQEKIGMDALAKTHPIFGHSSLMYRQGAYAALFSNGPTHILDLYIYMHLTTQGSIGLINKVLGGYTLGVGISTANSLHELVRESLEYARSRGLSENTFQYSMARQFFIFSKKAIVENNFPIYRYLIQQSIKHKVISTTQILMYLLRYWPSLIEKTYSLLKKSNSKKLGV